MSWVLLAVCFLREYEDASAFDAIGKALDMPNNLINLENENTSSSNFKYSEL